MINNHVCSLLVFRLGDCLHGTTINIVFCHKEWLNHGVWLILGVNPAYIARSSRGTHNIMQHIF